MFRDGDDLRHGVADRNRQPNDAHQGHVGEVVADKRDFVGRQPASFENSNESRYLLPVRVLRDILGIDAELHGA